MNEFSHALNPCLFSVTCTSFTYSSEFMNLLSRFRHLCPRRIFIGVNPYLTLISSHSYSLFLLTKNLVFPLLSNLSPFPISLLSKGFISKPAHLTGGMKVISSPSIKIFLHGFVIAVLSSLMLLRLLCAHQYIYLLILLLSEELLF